MKHIREAENIKNNLKLITFNDSLVEILFTSFIKSALNRKTSFTTIH